jgi:hypothetical protein
MARKNKQEKSDNVVEMAAPAPEPWPISQGEAEVPTYTLLATCKWHLLALIAVRNLAEEAKGIDPLTVAELRDTVRKFEIYEETYLRRRR